MALKDWRKIPKNKFEEDDDTLLYKWEHKYSWETVGVSYLKDIKKFDVWYKGKHQKYFKTKTQALKFAKEYMRKH